ncbi:MAG: tol-pal system protein YbgF [Bdellovibrionales bacterium]
MTKRFLFSSSALLLSLMLVAPALAQETTNAAVTNMEMRLSSVEDQLRALTGKVEQMDYKARRLETALQRMQDDYEQRLMKLETAASATRQQVSVPASPASSEPSDENEDENTSEQPAVTGSLGGVKVRGNTVTGGIINPQSPPLPDKPDDYGLTAQEAYDRAFGLLRQADYENAEKAFKGFIDKFKDDKLVDNAKYWYAETFYVRGKFGDAAIGFADALQQNPKGNKAPDSLLKLAMSLGAMEKTQDACDALSALKAKYPTASSTIRSRAKQEWARLKCK